MLVHSVEFRLADTVNRHWSIGEIAMARRLQSGLVNDTYVLETEGAKSEKFIFQHLGAVFTSPDVIIDQAVVGQHLRRQGFVIPEPLLTDRGMPFAYCDGRLSKLLSFIEHDERPKEKLNTKMTESAAALLGRIHRSMATITYRPKFCIPNFHNRFHYIKELLARLKDGRFASKQEDALELAAGIISGLDANNFPVNLKLQIIHGDPKLDNFLFREEEAIGMIDMDTLMVSPILTDLGDAFRSWMQSPLGTFDRKRARSSYLAYMEENPCGYSFDEVCSATITISLELAARFLIDYFDESYFKWDSDKYQSAAEHNIARSWFFLKYALSVTD